MCQLGGYHEHTPNAVHTEKHQQDQRWLHDRLTITSGLFLLIVCEAMFLYFSLRTDVHSDLWYNNKLQFIALVLQEVVLHCGSSCSAVGGPFKDDSSLVAFCTAEWTTFAT